VLEGDDEHRPAVVGGERRGARSQPVVLFHRVSEEVLALAVEREDVARTLLEVKNLLEPPSTLLRPGILFPALWRTALSPFTRRKKSRSPKPKATQPTSGWIALSYGGTSPELYRPIPRYLCTSDPALLLPLVGRNLFPK
jgi:hypothetical protein